MTTETVESAEPATVVNVVNAVVLCPVCSTAYDVQVDGQTITVLCHTCAVTVTIAGATPKTFADHAMLG